MDNKIPHILIVDDDINLLSTMSDILELKGFAPVTASTGVAALSQLEEHDFELALIDLRLEDMSGLKILEAIKARSPETECILLTGHASQNSAIEAIQMGVYGFFQKPFEMEQLLLSIQRAVEKRATGKSLRESERFAQATVDALSSHLAILDGTGVILTVNRAWREFAKANSTGDLHLKLCEGANYLTICDTAKGDNSEGAAAMAAGIRAVMSGRQDEFLLEYPCHSPIAKYWFNARVSRFPGAGDLRVAVSHENITERKLTEVKLQNSEKRFRALLENGRDSISLLAADGTLLWESPAVNSTLGYAPNQFVGHALYELLHPDDQVQIQNLFAQIVQTPGKSQDGIFRLRHGDGVWRWIEATATNLLNEPSVRGIIINYRDITERKQAEESLSASEAKLRALVEQVPVVVYTESAGTRETQYISPQVKKLTGYTSIEWIKDHELWKKIIHPEDLGTLLAEDERTNATHEPFYAEYRILTRDGRTLWVQDEAVMIESLEGASLFWQGMMYDITERKQAEVALQESEALYRQAIEVAGAVPYLQSYDSNGTNVHYNFIGEGISLITGYSAQEFNKTLFDSLKQESNLLEDLAGYSMEEAFRKVRSGQIPLWKCEHRIRARDGKTHWIFESAVELYTKNGVAKGSIGMFQDITERKQAEEALRESRLLFSLLIENMPQNIYAKDTNGRFIFANQHYCTTEGRSLEEIVGKTDFELHPSERAEKYLIDDRLVIETGETIEKEEEHQPLGKDKFFVQVIKTPFYYSKGKPAGVLGIFWDITERKLAEKNLHQRVKELELLYQSGLVFSQLLNPREIARKIIELLGEKLDWHHTAIRLVHGQDELELLAFDQPGLESTPETQVVEVHFNNLVTRIDKGLSGWALQQSKIVRSGDVGSDPHYMASYPGINSGLYVPLKSGDHILGVISIESKQPNAFSEADEQLLTTLANQAANAFENARLYQETNRYAQELEQRVQERTADLSIVNADLARAVRVKDEFLASMSHELRTPLTGVLGLSEALQLKVYGELNDKQSSALKNIEESGRHLLELINDILDLSKIEAGKLELQFAPCSLGDVCQASLQLIKGMAQHKNQHVHYSPPTMPIIVRADARHLKQMLVNLLSNAIKFTPEDSDLGLEIDANESERKIRLTVWDKGIGIKPEDLQKLFKPFVQLDSGLAREYSGTGLGLSLVHRLTELHNGGIEVESSFGQGSRFTVILPWSPENTTPIPYIMRHGNTGRLFNAVVSPETSKAPLVMYVDDNEMVLQMVADFLEAKQYRVTKVRNGTELLERAAEIHPDIMLVDIQMPGIGGMETIRRIRAHPDPLVAAAPVIAVTALAMATDRERCLRAGANDYMSKPLKLNELAAAIRKLLEGKQ